MRISFLASSTIFFILQTLINYSFLAGSACFNDEETENFTVWISLFSPEKNLVRTTDDLRLNVRHNGFFWTPYGNCSLTNHIIGMVYIAKCKIPRKIRVPTNIVQLVVARSPNCTTNCTQKNNTSAQVIAKYEVVLENYEQCIPIGILKKTLDVLSKNTTRAIVTWYSEDLSKIEQTNTNSKTEILIDGRHTARLNCTCPQGNTCEAQRRGRLPPTNCHVELMGFIKCNKRDYEICVKTSHNATEEGVVVRCSQYRPPCTRASTAGGYKDMTDNVMTTVIVIFIVLVVVILALGIWINRNVSYREMYRAFRNSEDEEYMVEE